MMQDGRSALTAFSAMCIFLVLPLFSGHGETLYHWTDDAGRPCYSNVSPPAGKKAFRVYTGTRRESNRLNAGRAFPETRSEGEMPVKADEPHAGVSKAYLNRRIADRKRTIGHIEALLRKHPNDTALRKSLFKKRRYLFEDLTRLKNVRP